MLPWELWYKIIIYLHRKTKKDRMWPIEWQHHEWSRVTLKITLAAWNLSTPHTSENTVCICDGMFTHELESVACTCNVKLCWYLRTSHAHRQSHTLHKWQCLGNGARNRRYYDRQLERSGPSGLYGSRRGMGTIHNAQLLYTLLEFYRQDVCRAYAAISITQYSRLDWFWGFSPRRGDMLMNFTTE